MFKVMISEESLTFQLNNKNDRFSVFSSLEHRSSYKEDRIDSNEYWLEEAGMSLECSGDRKTFLVYSKIFFSKRLYQKSTEKIIKNGQFSFFYSLLLIFLSFFELQISLDFNEITHSQDSSKKIWRNYRVFLIFPDFSRFLPIFESLSLFTTKFC